MSCRCSLALCLLAIACGDGAAPPPDTLVVGAVTVETDPLRLVVAAPHGQLVVDDFVELATAASFSETRYYDPRDLGADSLQWHVATRALSWDPDTGRLGLDNGAGLRLAEGPRSGVATLTLDAGEIADAVLLRLVMPRDPAEPIFGFGESFASAEAGGSIREMQLRVDLTSESSLNEVHVPVPLSLWPARGAGLFAEDPRAGAFDVGATRPDAVLATFTLAAPGPLDVHLFTAAEPLELLRTYAQLTALPAVPPRWAFAPQQWRNAHDSSQQVRDDAQAMRDNDIPGSTIWIDNPWQTGYNDFTFDESRFDGPQQLIDDLRAQGYEVLVWSTPYVNREGTTAADFLEAAANQYLVRGDNGAPFVFPWQDGPGALVDFTTPGATEWWRQRIGRVVSMGVSGFKLDFGEDVVPELAGNLAPLHLTAGDAQVMHEAYTTHYHEAYLGALPPGDGFLITRAGTYGDQAVNTCIWPGDLDNDFSLHGVDNGSGAVNVGGLPAAVAAMLSLSVSGYPFFGSDIGGFRNGVPDTEVLIRWSQYAALGTIMQLGGGGTSHNPWDTALFDPPALAVYQRYARLHMDLVPFLYTLARRAGSDGTPVTVPTRLVYPDAASDDATYLIGDALFVAPVIEGGATTRDVILPAGRWIDWWSGAATEGDGVTSMIAAAPLDTLPLWRRSNAFVPMFARPADTLIPATTPGVTSYADPAYGRELRLLITPEAGPAKVALFDGCTASAAADGAEYLLSATAGDEFDIVTFDLDLRAATAPAVASAAAVSLDGAALPVATGESELESCAAPGCWLAAPGRLRIRVHLPDAAAHAVRVSPL